MRNKMVNKAWMKYKGEGKTHINMTDFVFDVMIDMEYLDVRKRYPIFYQNKNSDNEWIASERGVYHEVDVAGAQVLLQENGKMIFHRTYVEIDGEWHDNKIQKNKDDTAEQMIKEYHESDPCLGHYRIIRIKKAVVLEAMKTGKPGYLKAKLAKVVAAL